jgi:hypothetical protein
MKPSASADERARVAKRFAFMATPSQGVAIAFTPEPSEPLPAGTGYVFSFPETGKRALRFGPLFPVHSGVST